MECPICMEHKDEVYIFNCNHIFCLQCTLSLQTCKSYNKCPLCRSVCFMPNKGIYHQDKNLSRLMSFIN